MPSWPLSWPCALGGLAGSAGQSGGGGEGLWGGGGRGPDRGGRLEAPRAGALAARPAARLETLTQRAAQRSYGPYPSLRALQRGLLPPRICAGLCSGLRDCRARARVIVGVGLMRAGAGRAGAGGVCGLGGGWVGRGGAGADSGGARLRSGQCPPPAPQPRSPYVR